ncbi:LysM peptidoglycan-binding domain-containing protein [Anaerocolumna sp. AGMB13025]|uniref:LysM peptidoglycan-binding domain-containing protein n=1 Tax=Anaerocolumna sp. AGMB13025 TaxID=3039116 RepID=UPI00241D8E3B|nr:LysM peptidoglycan-binding domain-containing protein [Anaerocolumna sp. AGMB13025]WFR55334.1 LysM peptidoglycan-binding domain-containing protein [Anaerocolumna sp. AGMB13025]
MTIHVVQPGDTISSIANQYGVTQDRIITDNELPNPNNLVVGQALAILYTDVTHTVVQGDTLYGIADQYGVTPTQILQNNPWISEAEGLVPGQLVVISFVKDENLGNITINGYAYPFIDRTVLRKTLPYLTYLSIFNYGFTPEGELIAPDDEELIQLALDFNVAPLMVLAPMDANGAFSNELAHAMFTNPQGQNQLIQNILSTLKAKNYKGVDVDFEFVLPEDKQLFIDFITNLKNALEPQGYIVTVALAPKTSGDQAGLLYSAHDYPTIGGIADLVLLMTYEWGYTYGRVGYRLYFYWINIPIFYCIMNIF